MNRPSSQTGVKSTVSENKPKLTPSTSRDVKTPNDDVTKTVKLKLNRPSSQTGVKSDDQVVKTLKLKQKNISPVTSTGKKVTETLTLKRRDPESQSDISKTQTIKLRVHKPQSRAGSGITEKKTLNQNVTQVKDPSVKIEQKEVSSLKNESSISNELSMELEAALDALSPDTLNSEDEVFKKEDTVPAESEQAPTMEKMVIPPIQIEKTSPNLDNKKIPSLKDKSGISNELGLELEAALDVLSPDTISPKEETTEKENLGLVKSDESLSAGKMKETNEISNDFPVGKQKELGFIFVLVALLTLVGLVGFVYISFSSLSFFG